MIYLCFYVRQHLINCTQLHTKDTSVVEDAFNLSQTAIVHFMKCQQDTDFHLEGLEVNSLPVCFLLI